MKSNCSHPFSVMKKRKEFVRMSHAADKVVTKSFVMQYAPREDAEICVGYTASKKVGGAVQRGRAKRRLRALVDQSIRLNTGSSFPCGYDLVFIARHSIVRREFSKIGKDFEVAISGLKG
jgi:ribonuclease P protein component